MLLDNELDIYTETWPELEKLKTQGLIKSLGVSNFNSQQLDQLIKTATIKPVTNQIECHPLLSQTKMIEFCRKHNIYLTAYLPMGGSPSQATKDEPTKGSTNVRLELFESDIIKKLALKYNKSPGQILLKFQVQRNVIVIPKSVTKSRIESNKEIFDFELNPEDLEELGQMNRNNRILAFEEWKDSKYYPFKAGVEF